MKTSLFSIVFVCGIALCTAAPSAAGASPQERPMDRSCSADDFDCRIARLEARIDYLIDLLEARRDGTDRGGRPGRGQDMVVEQSCSFTSCPDMAVQLCQRAGFARGVPAEIRNTSGWPTLVRATCSD